MRNVLFGLSLVSILFSACSSTDSEPSGGAGAAGVAGKAAGGAAGRADASGAGGTSDEAGAAGTAGAAGSDDGPSVCLDSGLGEIELVVTGLPATVAASISISGASEALESESTTLSDAPGGQYSVIAKRVYDADPLVRTVYDAQIDAPTFCLEDGGTQSVTVNYAPVAPSNQLWTILRSHGGAPLRGFGSSRLKASGSPMATSEVFLSAERTLAFDHAGNLWATGEDLGPGTILTRYAPAWLTGVGEPRADYAFHLAIAFCAPPETNGVVAATTKGIALDSSGNIWLSVCNKKVLRVDRPETTPGASEEPEDITPSVTLSGFSAQNEDLAFDSAGNLWLAAGGQVLRFDRARLDRNDAGTPDCVLDVTTDDATPLSLKANFLAFDGAGNLWATDVAGSTLFQIAKADLAYEGTNSVVAKAHLTVSGSMTNLGRPAFDDEGSLWTPLTESSFGKLTAEQLTVSSSAAAPTVPAVVISGVGPDALAFFPAASGLPLPSAQP